MSLRGAAGPPPCPGAAPRWFWQSAQRPALAGCRPPGLSPAQPFRTTSGWKACWTASFRAMTPWCWTRQTLKPLFPTISLKRPRRRRQAQRKASRRHLPPRRPPRRSQSPPLLCPCRAPPRRLTLTLGTATWRRVNSQPLMGTMTPPQVKRSPMPTRPLPS